MTDIKVKPQSHLINILRDTRNHHPNFTLFLGAGSSVASGVTTATEMISDWRQKLYSMYGSGEGVDSYMNNYHWFKRPEEYSVLFETLYDQPSQRREYIETCLETANPSWGYIYLVNLIRNQAFNTVFTTNFDDLLNEACYLFSGDVRPLVCAHDSSIRTLRITSARPKIIKLHGDFLFDDIKNTVRELESLEDNMRDKFKQYATEFGMIVVGYAGHDRSIMDTLNTLLKSDYNFPHGIYWCVRKGSDISQKVKDLSRFPKFHIIEINGFDEFFAEHNSLNIELQPEMSDPYGALTARLNSLLEKVRVPDPDKTHPVIERDIRRLGSKIKSSSVNEHKILSRRKMTDGTANCDTTVQRSTIPYQLLAQVEQREGNISDAMNLIRQQFKTKPSLGSFQTAFDLLAISWDDQFCNEVMNHINCSRDLIGTKPGITLSIAVKLIELGKYDIANKILDLGLDVYQDGDTKSSYMHNYYIINKAQIKRHQNIKLSEDEILQLKNIVSGDNNSMAIIGALIVLGQFKDAAEMLSKETYKDVTTFREWPIFKLFPGEIQAQFKDDE